MTPGAKLFLVGGGIVATFGVLALMSSKKASAAPGTVVVPPHDGAQPETIPDLPEPGFTRDSPYSVPGVQDAQEAQRNLLRWWATEGIALLGADMSPADQAAQGVPQDFGSRSSDLSGQWDARTAAIAKVFEHYSGLTPEDGVLSQPLILALRRWADAQQLAPSAPAPSPTTPAPIVLPAPPMALPATPPPAVPLPPIVPPAAQVPIPSPLPPSEQPAVPFPPPPAPVDTTPLPAPGPVPMPPVPLPPIVPPSAQPVPAAALPAPSVVPADTAEMVNALLMAERQTGWNRVDPAVQAWQKSRKLKQDGKFGPASALTVASELGTVPIVRFWPKGSQKAAALQDYRAALLALANDAASSGDTGRAAQLKVSAQREQGQGFGVTANKAPALPAALQVGLAQVA
jgi:hypothetical protein